jgi:hypothetical protein
MPCDQLANVVCLVSVYAALSLHLLFIAFGSITGFHIPLPARILTGYGYGHGKSGLICVFQNTLAKMYE